MDKQKRTDNWQSYKDKLILSKRSGIKDLIDYLENETDFIYAPASTKFHLNEKGGLCLHHLNVLEAGVLIQKIYNLDLPKESIILTCLLHDICKINFYVETERWDGAHKEKTGQWRKMKVWGVDDKLPLGHGEKSAIIASQYIRLEADELAAIRWHMMGFDPGVHFSYPSGLPFRASMDKYPLLKLVIIADMMAELKESTKSKIISDSLPF